ncbi:MAG: hypothetical protein KIT73_00530 [Burkholderiales bacterium]|nr:hypothetical protein [Burkholderiales bacterium]
MSKKTRSTQAVAAAATVFVVAMIASPAEARATTQPDTVHLSCSQLTAQGDGVPGEGRCARQPDQNADWSTAGRPGRDTVFRGPRD